MVRGWRKEERKEERGKRKGKRRGRKKEEKLVDINRSYSNTTILH